MRRPGAALQFLFGVVGGWIVLRALTFAAPVVWDRVFPEGAPLQAVSALIWPDQEEGEVTAGDGPAATGNWPTLPALAAPSELVRPRSPVSVPPLISRPKHIVESRPVEQERGLAQTVAAPVDVRAPVPFATSGAEASPPPNLKSEPKIPAGSRWSVTGWMLWRPNVMGSLAQGPLLGGSQAGARIDYRLWEDRGRSLAFYGRGTRAIERPFAEEAAVGVALRPVRGVPVSIMAERRQRLGRGGRSGFALFAAGGVGPRPIAQRVEIEGYAQAGIVGLPGADGFADGKASLTYTLTCADQRPDIAMGMSLSGSAQPGASRLDIGPEVRVRLPVAGGHLRLSAEWRERIAGDARPSSGPAITLVADF